jgi:hypothetical protein
METESEIYCFVGVIYLDDARRFTTFRSMVPNVILSGSEWPYGWNGLCWYQMEYNEQVTSEAHTGDGLLGTSPLPPSPKPRVGT